MTTVLRTAFLLAFPHGGQRRARANAYAAATASRAAAGERAEATALLAGHRDAAVRPAPLRRAASD